MTAPTGPSARWPATARRVQLPEVERRVEWPELLTMARTAEDVGFDSLWLGDHLLYDLPGGVTRGPWEVWTSLAALAAVTERVELGPLVASTASTRRRCWPRGRHRRRDLGRPAASSAWARAGTSGSTRAFGFPFDHRISRFEEAFTIIRTLLRDGRIDFARQLLRVADCVLDPGPARPGGPPMMLGSTGPRMMRSGSRTSDRGTCGGATTATPRTGSPPCGNGSRTAAAEAGRAPGEVGGDGRGAGPAARGRRAGDGRLEVRTP